MAYDPKTRAMFMVDADGEDDALHTARDYLRGSKTKHQTQFWRSVIKEIERMKAEGN